MKSIPEEIAELRGMVVADLVQRYEAAFGKPPRVKHREWLWRRIAWKVQERRFGGLSTVAKKRLDELIGELDVPLGQRTVNGKVARPRSGDPPLGTALIRRWRGHDICATRTAEGWEHEGVVYGSLSAVAKAVTGSHMSGPAWFGLARRKEAVK